MFFPNIRIIINHSYKWICFHKELEKVLYLNTFDQYTESIQKYNEALAGGDTGKIIEARSEFASLGSQVDSLLSKDSNDKFSLLFDEVTDQLNEASVKVFDFRRRYQARKMLKTSLRKLPKTSRKLEIISKD